METLIWIAIFGASLALLIKATDTFIEGAEELGIHFGVEPFLIGVFVLGLGTSLPELVISLIAVLRGSTEVIVGNVLGSNIANVFLILGIAGVVVKKATVKYNFLDFDIPLFITSAFVLAVMLWDGVFVFSEATFLLGIFLLYLIYSVSNHRKKSIIPEEVKEEKKEKNGLKISTVLRIFLSPILIYFGAKYTIEAVIYVSELLKISEDIIAASAVALGTSLPELVVSYAAIRKGKIDEMIGNIVGSNILNILLVMGIPALITSITVPEAMLTFALPMMLVATIAVFIVIQDKQVTRTEGATLILFYIFFLGELFNFI